MLSQTILTAVAALLAAVDASPLKRLDARQGGCYAIRGASGSGCLRQEIRAVLADSTSRSCLLSSLRHMQDTLTEGNFLSYYQISAIHGEPGNVEWDGGGPKGSGYCHHGDVLFPVWHRPYLMLVDQQLQASCRIANSGNACCNCIRMPYWDWAADSSIPDDFTQPTVEIGGQTVHNPLYSYQFKNGAPFQTSGFAQNDETLRHGTQSGGSWTSNNAEAQRQMQQAFSYLQQRTYRMLTQQKSWSEFSNHAVDGTTNDPDPAYDSIESIHDQVHPYIGGTNGHMTYIPYSSFDPIFGMHHAQVDHLTAMSQEIFGTYANDDRDLNPFHSSSDCQFHTAQSVRDVRNCGYDYADLTGQGGRRASAIRAAQRYSGSSSSNAAATKVKRGDKRSCKLWQHFSTKRVISEILDKVDKKKGGDDDDEYVRKIYRKDGDKTKYTETAIHFSFTGHYFAYVFLTDGEVGDDVSKWRDNDGFVATYTVFGKTKVDGMKMGPVAGSVPLTNACRQLISQKRLDKMDDDSLKKYFEKHLKVRFTDGKGKAVDRKEVKDCKLSVVRYDVEAPKKDTELPKYGKGEVIYHP